MKDYQRSFWGIVFIFLMSIMLIKFMDCEKQKQEIRENEYPVNRWMLHDTNATYIKTDTIIKDESIQVKKNYYEQVY